MMKERQFKKLCKKASVFCGDNVFVEQGVHYKGWYTCYESDEFDAEDCWPWLVGCFDSDVNTVIDDDSECGISWVGESQHVKSTPKNVFKWATSTYEVRKGSHK